MKLISSFLVSLVLASTACGGVPDEQTGQTSEALNGLVMTVQHGWWGLNRAHWLSITDAAAGQLDGRAANSFWATGYPFNDPSQDPDPGQDKDVRINYQCSNVARKVAYIPPEANGHQALGEYYPQCTELPASAPTTLTIDSAFYAANCGHSRNVTGNIGGECNGFGMCQYWVDYRQWGITDPAPGCDKNLLVNYHCGSTALSHNFTGERQNRKVEVSCWSPYYKG